MNESGLSAIRPANAHSDTLVKKEKFLRIAAVMDRCPYSRASIYRLVKSGDFPKPYSLGAGAVAWREADIDDWIQARIDSAQAAEAR